MPLIKAYANGVGVTKCLFSGRGTIAVVASVDSMVAVASMVSIAAVVSMVAVTMF